MAACLLCKYDLRSALILNLLLRFLRSEEFKIKGKMEKCIVRDPILRLAKGTLIGATEKQLQKNGRIHLVVGTREKDVYEVAVPFDLKQGEEIYLNTALLPKDLRARMTGTIAEPEVQESEEQEPENQEQEEQGSEELESEELESEETNDFDGSQEPDDLNAFADLEEKKEPKAKKKSGSKKQAKKK